ncbi:MAG: TIM-barrel domain-containing protein [Bacteroidota bacterium]
MRFTPYGDHIVRVQTVRAHEEFFPDDRYEMVESHSWTGEIKKQENVRTVYLSSAREDGITVEIQKEPFKISFVESELGTTLFSEKDGIQWNGDTISVSFMSDTTEHFTGLGHGFYGRESSLDLRGKIIRRNYGSQHGEQAPLIVPFFLSSKGYGVFLNSTFPNTFDFNSDGKYQFSINGDARMDYFVIVGPAFRDIIDRYTQLTGRPRLLPKAAFGLALSDKGNDHTTNDPSDERWWKKKITEHRNAGFPLDHVVNDNRWRAGGGQRCLSYFEWDTTRYPDPKEYESWIRSKGLILTIDFNRCIASHSEGWKSTFNIPKSDDIDFNESAPDLTRKDVREWFWNLFWTKSLDTKLKYPGDALWIDEFDEMGKASSDMVLGNGRTWREMKNYWFFLVAKSLVQQGWDKEFQDTKRPFVWVRGMTAGGQRYATLWSGDIKPNYADMRTQIRSLQLAGISGFPFWGHDAGGFNNWEEKRGPDDAMYRQWSMAFGSFTPFWKPHGMGRSRWPLDRPADVQRDAHIYSELRYRLMPYLYSAAYAASESGIPMARAMVIDNQNNEKAWSHDLEYMWGESMLVAPNCSDSDAVNVWLPEGMWFDYWNDQLLTGDRELSYKAPLGVLPLFVKAGSIIPMGNYAVSTAFLSSESLTVHVYTGNDVRFQLIEDDGVTERYRSKGEIRRTNFSYSESKSTLSISGSSGTYTGASSRRMYRIDFHGMDGNVCAQVNGKIIPEEKSLTRTSERILWNKNRTILSILLPQCSVTDSMTISLVKKCR